MEEKTFNAEHSLVHVVALDGIVRDGIDPEFCIKFQKQFQFYMNMVNVLATASPKYLMKDFC